MAPPTTQRRRIVLTTFGSLGDLHPYVAIALELRSRGHDTVIATSPTYREKLEALGIAFHPLRPDLGDVTADPELMRRVMDLEQGPEVVVRELMMPHLRGTVRCQTPSRRCPQRGTVSDTLSSLSTT